MIIAVSESLSFINTIIESMADSPFIFLFGLAIVLIIFRNIFDFIT